MNAIQSHFLHFSLLLQQPNSNYGGHAHYRSFTKVANTGYQFLTSYFSLRGWTASATLLRGREISPPTNLMRQDARLPYPPNHCRLDLLVLTQTYFQGSRRRHNQPRFLHAAVSLRVQSWAPFCSSSSSMNYLTYCQAMLYCLPTMSS